MRKNIVLLTATITPLYGQAHLQLVNSSSRFNEYQQALKFYYQCLEKNIIDNIIFVENSLYDLSPLMREFKHDKIEWISFYGLDYDVSYHRGYGELKLLDYAYGVSTILKTSLFDDVVWKISGRYILKNIATIIKHAPGDFKIYCETSEQWSEMSVMAWSVKSFNCFIHPILKDFATDMAPELILPKKMKKWKNEYSGIIMHFSWPPYLVGRRGTDGKPFQGKLSSLVHIKNIVFYLLRKNS